MNIRKGISEKWDPRPVTLGGTQDLRPGTHLIGGNRDLRLGTLKAGHETQDPGLLSIYLTLTQILQLKSSIEKIKKKKKITSLHEHKANGCQLKNKTVKNIFF